MARQQVKGVFETMLKPSSHAMPLRWNGPLTFQQVLDTWEKMEIPFDKAGKPIMPSLLVDSATQTELNEKLPQWLQDPEYMKQLTQLIEQKRKEFDERETRRRLVD